MSSRWFTAMSGPLTVPATIAALWVESPTAKILLGLTAFICFWASAYWMWNAEREKVVALEAAAEVAHHADTKSAELAGIINAMMEKALRYDFKPDENFRKLYAEIDASTHPAWIANDVKQLRRDFLNRCGILGSRNETGYTLAELKGCQKEAKEFGDLLIGRLTGAPKPSPLNPAVGTDDSFVRLKSDSRKSIR